MVSAIVCVDKNWGIGYQGELLINIPEDMRFFRDKTKNNIVIMGRKTYDSLPSKPLPYRTNVVITSKIDKPCEIDEKGTWFVTMDFIKSVLYSHNSFPESQINCYVIGGGQVYKELLPYCNQAYVTKVKRTYNDVDTYFPNIDKSVEWKMMNNGEEKVYRGISYKFCVYKKGV